MIDPLSSFIHRQAGLHGPVMLMYHSVMPGDGCPDWPWAVSMRRFRQQLDLLAATGWATPTMAELVAMPEKWPGRTVVITFDDGYADNLAACEELQKRGMRASWFVVTGSLGRNPVWQADGRPAGRLLDTSELRHIQSAGMEIGSHTVNHVPLTGLDEAGRRSELIISKTEIESVTGCPVSSFAYPYGAWDERCVEAVRQAGYKAACTTRTGWALRDGNPYQLRRLTVFNTDTAGSLARKLYLGANNANWRQVWRHAAQRLAWRIGL